MAIANNPTMEKQLTISGEQIEDIVKKSTEIDKNTADIKEIKKALTENGGSLDLTEIKERVDTLEAAYEKLNSLAVTSASDIASNEVRFNNFKETTKPIEEVTYTKEEVDDAIIAKVTELVSGAPEDFDTLKEMSDWLVSHENSAAAMNSAIQENATKTAQNSNDILANAENTAINSGTIGYKKRNFLYNGSQSRERYGITATVNSDGSITLNGTSTSSGAFMLFSNLQTGATPEGSQFSNNKQWIPPGRYLMSQGGVTGVTLQVRVSEVANSEGDFFSCSTNETTITIQEKHTYVWCRILISANVSFDNITVYPMIRMYEDTDNSFAPYKASVEERLQALEDRIAELTTTTVEQG